MDGLILLRRAHEAGLAVQAEGDKLVIRGPKRAESVARLLIVHKPEVLAALVPREAPDRTPDEDATDRALWRDRYAARIVYWFSRGASLAGSRAAGVRRIDSLLAPAPWRPPRSWPLRRMRR